MTQYQYEGRKIPELIMKKIQDGRLVVDPGVLMAVLSTLFHLQDREKMPRLSYGKAIKVRPKNNGNNAFQGIQMNIFGIFIWHYHVSKGGTLKNLASGTKSYTINGTSKLGDLSVPKKHRMTTRVRAWAKLGESVEVNLYRIQAETKKIADHRKYAEHVLNGILNYLEGL